MDKYIVGPDLVETPDGYDGYSNTIQAALSGVSGVDEKQIDVLPGIYAESLTTIFENKVLNALGSIFVDGSGTGNNVFHNTKPGIKIIGDFHFKGADSGKYNFYSSRTDTFCSGITVSDGDRAFFTYGGNFWDCSIFGKKDGYPGYQIYMKSVGNAANFMYCQFVGLPGPIISYEGTVNLYNCAVYGFAGKIFQLNGLLADTPEINVINCTLAGNNAKQARIIDKATAVLSQDINLKNCLCLKVPYLTAATSYERATDLGGNIGLSSGLIDTDCFPKFLARRNPVYVSFWVDDWDHAQQWEEMAGMLDVHKWKGTWAIETQRCERAGGWPTVRAEQSKGHEIAAHSRNETNLESYEIFDIISSVACTITIDVGVDTLNLSTGQILTLSDYADTGELITALNSIATITCVSHPGTDYTTQSLPEYLADVSAQDISSLYTASNDPNLLYAGEITGPKGDIESNIAGYTCNTFLCPGHRSNDAARTAMKNAGYTGCRGSITENFSGIDGYNRYNMYCSRPTDLLGTDTGTWKMKIASLIERMGFTGGVMSFYVHNWTEFGGTIEEGKAMFATLLSIVAASGASVLPFGEAMAKMLDNSTSSDDITYTLIDSENENLRTETVSPCTGTGDIIPGIHDQPNPAMDIGGKPVLFTPNIGPYDGRTTETITEADYAPTGFEVRAGATLTLKGGWAVDLSGLTDTGEITCKLSGEIDSFVPNGSNTKLKAVPGPQRIFNLGSSTFG